MQDIVELSPDQTPTANAIYAALRFEPSRPERDRTFGLQDADGAWVALARIQHHADGALELGGYWVRDDLRGQGLARRMVMHTLAALDGRSDGVYCIPLDHLVGFYESCGLQHIAADDVAALPTVIQKKIATCASTFDGCGESGSRYSGSTVLRP